MIVEVPTLDDPRLDAYARLTDVQLRNRLEPEKGVFVAESDKVIRRALAGGMQPLSLLMEPKWLPLMRPVIDHVAQRFPSVPVFVVPHAELERLTGFELTRGALGAFRRPALPTVAEACAQARRVAVLEDITNHTNVGAIFRSAAALGIDAVLVTPACYEPSSKVPGPASGMWMPRRRGRPNRRRRGGNRTGGRRNRGQPNRRRHRGRKAAFPSCTNWVSRRRRWRWQTTPSPLTTRGLPPRNGWRSCWAPKATACPPPPSHAATTPCASPCTTASIPSTWPPQAPWRSGNCAPADALRPRGPAAVR